MNPDWLRIHLLQEGIKPEVVVAMMAVPRERFVPAELRSVAWDDEALPIGRGQTISQPTVVALMIQALDIRPGDNVLDVGTGSGYQAAVLAACGAQVHGVERIAELAERAQATLTELGWKIPVVCADGTRGLPAAAPFDAINVAAATPTCPPSLLDQLREPGDGKRGGRLVIPLGSAGLGLAQELVLMERVARGYQRTKLLDVLFVPLISEPEERDRAVPAVPESGHRALHWWRGPSAG